MINLDDYPPCRDCGAALDVSGPTEEGPGWYADCRACGFQLLQKGEERPTWRWLAEQDHAVRVLVEEVERLTGAVMADIVVEQRDAAEDHSDALARELRRARLDRDVANERADGLATEVVRLRGGRLARLRRWVGL